jgi:predicted permease
VQQVREATRDVWRFAWLESLVRDVRHGCRLIRRAPGFAVVVVATLGLVIGANATVFSVMHAVLWRPLPYPDVDRLVLIDSEVRGVRDIGIADAEGRDLRAEAALFDRLGHLVTVDAHVNVGGEMERVVAASATDDVLVMLGAMPMTLGRPLQGASDGGMESTIHAIVISHQLWTRRLASDRHVLGRHIEVNNIDVQIVGVLPPDFRVHLPRLSGAPEIVDVWFPRAFEDDRRNRGQIALARLAGGVSLQEARTRLSLIAERASIEHAAVYGPQGLHLSIAPLQERLTADVRGALWVLAAAVAFVLLIGCVNVATLMLARARARQQEMAVRRALGAGSVRLVRQLFTEAAVLGILGAASGFLIAHLGVYVIDWLRPSHLPRQSAIRVTSEAAVFIGLVTLVVSVIFGLLPAFSGGRGHHQSLKAGRASVQRAGIRRMQRVMVIAEVALSIVPLVAAGLMLRTFVNMIEAPLGFDPNGLITAKVAMSFRAFPETSDRARLLRDAIAQVRQIPGVVEVSAGGPLPLDGWAQTRTYAHPQDTSATSRATMQSVFPGYLHVTRTPLLAGRDFTDDDIEQQRNVVIVEERIAAQVWPQGAVGRRLALGRGRGLVELDIIGITRSVRATSVREEPLPHLFLPYHLWAGGQALVIRTPLSAAALGPAVKQGVEALGTRRPVFDIRPMQDYVDESVGDTRFAMLVLVGFAAAAILLAAVGLYGTLAYVASQRRQEFGVRMALGASAMRVMRGVASEGLWLAAIGAALGLAGALATMGLLEGLLYHVTPFDGVTLITVTVLVALTALVAATIPAWRASQTNPSLVLRTGE